jgi:hypothetical protein
MPRGDKSSYSTKQRHQAADIEEGYEKRGVGKKEAERRAWATVNKEAGGGKKKKSSKKAGKKAASSTKHSTKKGAKKKTGGKKSRKKAS